MALPLSNYPSSPPKKRKERGQPWGGDVWKNMSTRPGFLDSHVFTSDLDKKGPSQNQQSCIKTNKHTISEFNTKVELMYMDIYYLYISLSFLLFDVENQ